MLRPGTCSLALQRAPEVRRNRPKLALVERGPDPVEEVCDWVLRWRTSALKRLRGGFQSLGLSRPVRLWAFGVAGSMRLSGTPFTTLT